MNDPAFHIALAKGIDDIFNEGLVLTEEVTRYLEATFGTADIAAVLAGPPDSEIDSLLELLCYPDWKVQVRIEALLRQQPFTAEQYQAVVRHLCAQPLRTRIVASSGTPLCTIDIPAFALEAFVRRLNITWQPPPALLQAVERHYDLPRGLEILVHLRNARVAWHADQISLMALFLEKMGPVSEQFRTSLAFLISILSELAPAADPYAFLAAKKFFYFQSLCKAEDFEKKRLAGNMEMLILQGARAAYGGLAQWRDHMRQIDLICQALFGRTQFFQQPAELCLDGEHAGAAGKIQDVIRLLS
jgi:hypothetical protein